ncbi:MAG: hemerythrin domain-containing protein [Actinomycetes bacterium]
MPNTDPATPNPPFPQWDMWFMDLVHAAIVRDLNRLADVTADGVSDGAIARWRFVSDVLQTHHDAEDQYLWPMVRDHAGDDPGVQPIMDAMESEHAAIDPAIEQIGDALTARDAEAASEQLRALATATAAHFEHEQTDAVPLLSRYVDPETRTTFEKSQRAGIPKSQQMLFFPWLTDGTDSKTAAAAWGVLPTPVRMMIKPIGSRKYAAFNAASFD